MESTSSSLLFRLRQFSSEADWNRFSRLYRPLIHRWAEQTGLQPTDADDLAQDVLTSLTQKLRAFEYDSGRSFRAWLKTVTMNHWRDRMKRIASRPLPAAGDALAEIPDESGIGRLIEQEHAAAVTRQAMQLIQEEFSTQSWNACWEFAVLKRPAADVARDLGMTPGAVYAASARVLARLRQELAGLID